MHFQNDLLLTMTKLKRKCIEKTHSSGHPKNLYFLSCILYFLGKLSHSSFTILPVQTRGRRKRERGTKEKEHENLSNTQIPKYSQLKRFYWNGRTLWHGGKRKGVCQLFSIGSRFMSLSVMKKTTGRCTQYI